MDINWIYFELQSWLGNFGFLIAKKLAELTASRVERAIEQAEGGRDLHREEIARMRAAIETRDELILRLLVERRPCANDNSLHLFAAANDNLAASVADLLDRVRALEAVGR